MLTTSPSPRLTPSQQSNPRSTVGPQIRYENVRKSSISSSPIGRPRSAHVDAAPPPTQATSQWSRDKNSGTSASNDTPTQQPDRRNMVDAGTQYSPPPGYRSPTLSKRTATAQIALQPPVPPTQNSASSDAAMTAVQTLEGQSLKEQDNNNNNNPTTSTKRHASTSGETQVKSPKSQPAPQPTQTLVQDGKLAEQNQGPPKRARGEEPPAIIMPIKYETCDTRELVILISSMLMELIRYNDAIPLKDGHLTRFHSRAPPGISVLDYLQRLTTHATLSPPILLSMVYYIDRLCALYPAFTISSLTVHRFLITSATVASKGLSDSFWTNKTYARVGGVSVKELALLELEFLVRAQWRIVPKPEILIDYYRSLVERSPGYELEQVA